MGFEEQSKHINQTTIVKEILDRFKEMLLQGAILPGDKLPSENDMAEQFGVGKSSVREAVKMLDAVGVFESRQGFGTVISNTPRDDSLNPLIFQMILIQGSKSQLHDFRKVFETAYTFMAMDTMTDQDKAELERLLISSNSTREDADFHRAVLYSTHNPYIIRIGNNLIDLYELTLAPKIEALQMENKVNEEHKAIFEALCNKDEEKLKKVLDESYMLYEKYVVKNELNHLFDF